MLPGMCNVIFIFLLYRHLVDKDRQQVNVLLSNMFRVFWEENSILHKGLFVS